MPTKPLRLNGAPASCRELAILHSHFNRVRKNVGIVASAKQSRHGLDRASRGTFHHRADVVLRGSSELTLLCSGGRYSRFWHVTRTLPAMNFEANHANRFTENFHSELAQVVVFSNRGHLRAVVGELVAQPRRRLPLRAQNQLHKQSYACAVASSELGAGAKAFADALRVRLVADALGVAERALELRVRLARRLARHVQRFVDSASEADVWPTGGSPVNLVPASPLLVVHVARPRCR